MKLLVFKTEIGEVFVKLQKLSMKLMKLLVFQTVIYEVFVK